MICKKSIEVANEILLISQTPLSPIKLNNLVYFSHYWSLALTEKPLCEEPEAWPYGPIFRNLYISILGINELKDPICNGQIAILSSRFF